MKTLIHFLLTLVALLVGANLINGQLPGVVLVFAGVFAASLTVWTKRQYDRKFLPLARTRPLRLPQVHTRRDQPAPPRRLAA